MSSLHLAKRVLTALLVTTSTPPLSVQALRASSQQHAPGPRSAYWGPVAEIEGLPQVVTGRSYVFMTHHKTGTNLMQQVCNITARLVTGGLDQCAFCFALRPPAQPGGPPTCVPDPIPAHGPIRGTFSRFTLLSSSIAAEFDQLCRAAPNFRAVHMVRDPFQMLLSSYKYDSWLDTHEGRPFHWDQHIDPENKSLEETLELEAKDVQSGARGMAGVHKAAKTDDRVLALDLEHVYANFAASMTSVFTHLFGQLPEKQLNTLLSSVAHLDTKSPSSRFAVAVRASRSINSTEAEHQLNQMLLDGDTEVLKVKKIHDDMANSV